MAYVWMIGGIYYYLLWERYTPSYPPALADYPPVSILVPCHNEGDTARETLGVVVKQNYPDFEVIAINDGSTDNTAEILDELGEQYDNLRILHLATNQGKAMALRKGALVSPNEFLICIDGDALLDQNAALWMINHLATDPTIGAVTGNPRIRNRSTLLGKLQVGEFSSIIGLIKRTQQLYGRLFAVSGVIVGFRKKALQEIDYWNVDMVTEDIDVTWRLQLAGWEIRYEPNALCWILMPETLKGLWKQRLRWSQGGSEVIIRYFKSIWRWKSRSMWPLYLEYATSIFWAYCMVFVFLLWFIGLIIPLPHYLVVQPFAPSWFTTLLATTCLAQFAISMAIDSRFEQKGGKYFYWMIWYPIAYWLLTTLTSVVALPKALLKKQGERAVWVSPDRGLKPENENEDENEDDDNEE